MFMYFSTFYIYAQSNCCKQDLNLIAAISVDVDDIAIKLGTTCPVT